MTDEVKVTILPPGRALGAGDLQRWASRRLVGKSGAGKTKDEKRYLKGIKRAARKRRKLARRMLLDAEQVGCITSQKPVAKGAGPRPGMTWDQVRDINARRRLRAYQESDELGERMARDAER